MYIISLPIYIKYHFLRSLYIYPLCSILIPLVCYHFPSQLYIISICFVLLPSALYIIYHLNISFPSRVIAFPSLYTYHFPLVHTISLCLQLFPSALLLCFPQHSMYCIYCCHRPTTLRQLPETIHTCWEA